MLSTTSRRLFCQAGLRPNNVKLKQSKDCKDLVAPVQRLLSRGSQIWPGIILVVICALVPQPRVAIWVAWQDMELEWLGMPCYMHRQMLRTNVFQDVDPSPVGGKTS